MSHPVRPRFNNPSNFSAPGYAPPRLPFNEGPHFKRPFLPRLPPPPYGQLRPFGCGYRPNFGGDCFWMRPPRPPFMGPTLTFNQYPPGAGMGPRFRQPFRSNDTSGRPNVNINEQNGKAKKGAQKKKPKKRAPWMTAALSLEIENKNKLYKKCKKSNKPEDVNEYKKVRNNLNATCKKLKTLYLASIENENGEKATKPQEKCENTENNNHNAKKSNENLLNELKLETTELIATNMAEKVLENSLDSS